MASISVLLFFLFCGLELSSCCSDTCKIEFLESIPDGVTFPGKPRFKSIYQGWTEIISRAEQDINIAAYKVLLLASLDLNKDEIQEYSAEGNSIFRLLNEKAKTVDVNILDNDDKAGTRDAQILEDIGNINRQTINISSFLDSGINHLKLMIVDNKHFYLGSANFDWRSLNQKMELGVLVTDCPELAEDVRNCFDSLWGANQRIHENEILKPTTVAMFNYTNPFLISIEKECLPLYVAGNPLRLLDQGRSADIYALVSTILNANEFLYLCVMDYFPMLTYGDEHQFWPFIDNAIRNAVMRGVRVRFLGTTVHYPKVETKTLQSLAALDGMTDEKLGIYTDIKIKIFVVPSLEGASNKVNSIRRLHKKFAVSDSDIYVGTSNWSADYFDSTTGLSVAMRQNGTKRVLGAQLERMFKRDFESEYAHDLEVYIRECINSKSAEYCQYYEDSVSSISTHAQFSLITLSTAVLLSVL